MDKTKFFQFLSSSLNMLVGIFLISFIIEIGFKFYKTSSFPEAFNYWLSLFSVRKILGWVIISAASGLYRVYFTKEKVEGE